MRRVVCCLLIALVRLLTLPVSPVLAQEPHQRVGLADRSTDEEGPGRPGRDSASNSLRNVGRVSILRQSRRL